METERKEKLILIYTFRRNEKKTTKYIFDFYHEDWVHLIKN